MFFNKRFILASKSKSRQDILKNNKLNFTQVEPKCDEELEKKKASKNLSALGSPSTILIQLTSMVHNAAAR